MLHQCDRHAALVALKASVLSDCLDTLTHTRDLLPQTTWCTSAFDHNFHVIPAGYDPSGTYVQSEEALWTFDIPTRTWRHHEAFGDLLGPHLAIAMTVFKDQVFLLCNAPEDTDLAELYVLDPATLTWRLLRPHGAPGGFLLFSAAVLLKVQLIGQYEFLWSFVALLGLPHLCTDLQNCCLHLLQLRI